MSKQCGTCSLCCKVLAIEELNKPQGQWCQHCKPGNGCSIYQARPRSCSEWECLWLQNPELPEQLKPQNCKAVLGYAADSKNVVVYQTPEHPRAYLENRYLREFVTKMLKEEIDVFIVTGSEHKMLPAKKRDFVTDISIHIQK